MMYLMFGVVMNYDADFRCLQTVMIPRCWNEDSYMNMVSSLPAMKVSMYERKTFHITADNVKL